MSHSHRGPHCQGAWCVLRAVTGACSTHKRSPGVCGRDGPGSLCWDVPKCDPRRPGAGEGVRPHSQPWDTGGGLSDTNFQRHCHLFLKEGKCEKGKKYSSGAGTLGTDQTLACGRCAGGAVPAPLSPPLTRPPLTFTSGCCSSTCPAASRVLSSLMVGTVPSPPCTHSGTGACDRPSGW